jgi:hypothetical protein
VIESDWLQNEFVGQNLSAAAIYCGESPGFGEVIGRHNDIQALAMPWDIEFEVFDKYRIPGVVFPLRVLLDADGNVLFKGTGEEVDADPADPLECPNGADSCPCQGRGNLCLTHDAVLSALGL